MHLLLMALALMGGWLLRWQSAPLRGSGSLRWQFALSRLILPPLLLLTTSVAVLWMGMDGAMLGFSAGWIGCHLAKAILGFALLTLLIRIGQGWRLVHQVQQYPCEPVAQTIGYFLNTEIPFAAQVGFWRSKLVISRGLLNQLNDEQLEAVLIHEEAHAHYRDTFWFFWLGWLGHLTFWLPQTETLWQELLLLRELRADAWAAKKVDAIVVAESLLKIVQSSPLQNSSIQTSQIALTAIEASFNSDLTLNRLEERIDALLEPSESIEEQGRSWLWLGLGVLPLLTLPLHG